MGLGAFFAAKLSRTKIAAIDTASSPSETRRFSENLINFIMLL
jgi:hypothetical protein